MNHRGITDYAATCGVDRFLVNPFMNPIPPLDDSFLGVLGRNVSRKLSEITDGASNTLLVAEDAGHTEVWQMGKKVGAPPVNRQGAWCNPRTHLLIAGFNPVTGSKPGPCAVNCSNDLEVYSFHPGGANVLSADGPVRLLQANLDLNIMIALITRSQGEIIPADISW